MSIKFYMYRILAALSLLTPINRHPRLHILNEPSLIQLHNQILHHKITPIPSNNINPIRQSLNLHARIGNKVWKSNLAQRNRIVGEITQRGYTIGRSGTRLLFFGGIEVSAGFLVGEFGAVAVEGCV